MTNDELNGSGKYSSSPGVNGKAKKLTHFKFGKCRYERCDWGWSDAVHDNATMRVVRVEEFNIDLSSVLARVC